MSKHVAADLEFMVSGLAQGLDMSDAMIALTAVGDFLAGCVEDLDSGEATSDEIAERIRNTFTEP